MKQYKGIGYREFRVDELKEILGLKKTQYSAFKDFRRWVLDQALLLEFEGTLDRFMLDYYRKDGVESVVVRSTFFNFLDEKL
ncbi:MAG: replication initiation protein, partial [Gammaproteobacteria bacterium]|nr:replication initiation protein [Gammaproteobacteria bacterium]